MKFQFQLFCFLLFCLLASTPVTADRRGSNVNGNPIKNRMDDSVTGRIPGAPSFEEGALFGSCSAEDCILGGGGSTLWNVIPVYRPGMIEEAEPKPTGDSDTVDDKQVTTETKPSGFGRFPSFTSHSK